MNHFKRYKELYNQDLEQYKNIPLKQCIRINSLKMSPRKLLNRLQKKGVKVQKIANTDFGYRVVKSPFSLGATAEYLLGYYYIQEAASQMSVQLLQPQLNEIILDMAAAPGGKTTQIAQYLENTGVIVAVDTKTMRLHALTNNINRMGVTNTIAPCSGNFMADKKWLGRERSIDDFKEQAKKQKKLLKKGIAVLKQGGTLVYSTCSLEPEENEQVVEWAEHHLPVKLIQMHRYWPPEFQGFFIAVLRKI
jgi:tRNA (cytosine40_48-C5)-methyltransferase